MSAESKFLGRAYSSEFTLSVKKHRVSGLYVACLSIGEEYYETDPYVKEQDAKDELLGYIERVQEKLSQTIKDLEKI